MPDLTETPASAPNADATEAHFEASLAAALKVAPLPSHTDEDNSVIPESEKNQELAAQNADTKEDVKSDEEDEKEPEVKEPVKESPGTLGKARRLFSEGKIKEALELAGMPIDKVEPTTKQWKNIKAREEAMETEVTAVKAEATKAVQEKNYILQQLRPMVDGANAYAAGDFAKFLHLVTGDTPEAFQRKLIGQLHEAPKVDPATAARLDAMERERQAERAAWKAEQDKQREQAAKAQYEADVQAWKGGIVSALQTAEGGKFAAFAKIKDFVELVYAEQLNAFNPRTKATIDDVEAAEIVYERLYGGVVETIQPAGGNSGNTQAPRANGETPSAGTSAGKQTSLRQARAAEAAPGSNLPWSRENQERIMEDAIRKTRSVLSV